MEYRCPSNAARRWFVTTVTPLSIAPGGAVIAHDDITAIKQAELALAESQGRLNLTLEAAKIVAWEIDVATGAIHEVGPVADLVGRPAGFRHADARAFLRTVHRHDRRRLAEALLSAARDGRSFELDFRVPLAAGERWLLVKGRAARDEHNRPIKLLGIARDITEQHKAATTQQLLVSELNHRVKNMLAVVQSLATQSEGATGSVEDFQRAFALRLQAGPLTRPADARLVVGRAAERHRPRGAGAVRQCARRLGAVRRGRSSGAAVPPRCRHARHGVQRARNERRQVRRIFHVRRERGGRWSIAPEVAGVPRRSISNGSRAAAQKFAHPRRAASARC